MKIQNRIQLLVLLLAFSINTERVQGQSEPPALKNQLRVVFLNPGIDYEVKVGKATVLSLGSGIGYNSGLEEELSGFVGPFDPGGFGYIIAPFADVQYKWIYNRRQRLKKGKPLAYNSGNFISLRSFWKGKSLAIYNINRYDNNDFFVGITWGLQRSSGKFHFLFDLGPVYYFDTVGNSGFFPLMVQINLGMNLGKP